MSRIRLNQEYRNKIANRMRVHIEQEDTQEKEKFFQLRENFKAIQDKTWELAKICVARQYPHKDVSMAQYLQDKYPNVNTVAKDSCFHFGYMNNPVGEENNEDGEWRNDNRHTDNDDKDSRYITKHFDFRLDGNINGDESRRQNDFAYAYFRDELKGKVNKGEKCNPDINIEQKWGNGSGEENSSNPHWTQCEQANERELGLSGGRDNQNLYAKQWNNDYQLDLIGREYCRDRQIAVSREEYKTFEMWQQKKGHLIMAHYKWVKSILTQMKFVKDVIKGYKYLDEALEFATESDLKIDEAEIIRCNSSGLMIYNPKNASDMLKAMKNKSVSRADKIKDRLLYEKAQSQVVN